MRLSRSSSLSPNTGCKVKIPHWIWSVLTGTISEQKGSVGRVRREVLALFKLIGEKKVTKSWPCGNPVNISGSSRAQHIPAEEPLCSNDWMSHGYTPPPNEQLMVPFCQSINALLDKTDTDTHWAPPHQGKEQRHSKQMQIRLLLRDQDSRLKKEDSKDHPK